MFKSLPLPLSLGALENYLKSLCPISVIYKRKLIIPNLWGNKISNKVTTKTTLLNFSFPSDSVFSTSFYSQTYWNNFLLVFALFPSLFLSSSTYSNLLSAPNLNTCSLLPKFNILFQCPLSQWMAQPSDPMMHLSFIIPPALFIFNPFPNSFLFSPFPRPPPPLVWTTAKDSEVVYSHPPHNLSIYCSHHSQCISLLCWVILVYLTIWLMPFSATECKFH